jgi:hypothetical protein
MQSRYCCSRGLTQFAVVLRAQVESSMKGAEIIRNEITCLKVLLCQPRPNRLISSTQQAPALALRPVTAGYTIQFGLVLSKLEGANSNFVARNIPSPIGVEIDARYGTTSRLPASGANHISVSCWAARYVTRK